MNIEDGKVTTRDDTFGSSFRGLYLIAPMKDMIRLLGTPSFEGSGDDKVNYEWAWRVSAGLVTIYDYKTPKPLTDSEEIKWHIGGKKLPLEQYISFLKEAGFNASSIRVA